MTKARAAPLGATYNRLLIQAGSVQDQMSLLTELHALLFDRGYKDVAPTELVRSNAKCPSYKDVAPTELIRGIAKRPFLVFFRELRSRR